MLLTLLQNGPGVKASDILALSPAFWFRWNTGITEAGGFASAVADQSGNARNLSQGSGASQPAVTNGILAPDGNNKSMDSTSFALAQPFTWFFLMNQVVFGVGDTLVDGINGARGRVAQGAAQPALLLDSDGTIGGGVASNTNLALNTWGRVCCIFNGASSSITVEGGTPTTGNPGTTGIDAGLRFFTRGDGGSLYIEARLAEAILLPVAASAAQQATVLTWLQQQRMYAGV